MENIVVGVYDQKTQAQAAMDELLASGFSRDEVQLNPAHVPSASSAAGDTGHGIGHFFRTLFGMEDSDRGSDMYAEAVRRGSVVLLVNVRDDVRRARALEVMNRYDAIDIEERSSYWRSEGWSSFDTTAPLMTEDEIVQDRSRYGASMATTDTTASGRGGARVVSRTADTPLQADTLQTDMLDDADYRRHWQTAYGATGGRYEDYDPAYRYGWEMGGLDQYRNSRWEDVESDVRRDWEARHPGNAWDNFKDAIRYAMGRVRSAVTPDAAADDDYRRHWQTAYGTAGGRYEDYDAAYRYGSTLSGTERFRNYRWDDVEPDVRRDWESSHPGSTWDRVRDAVRYGAERVTGRRH